MKTKEFIALEKRLLPKFPGFAIKGSLMLMSPLDRTLRGFDFDGSDFDRTSFYVHAFFLPLCVPSEHLSFNFGERVRHNGADRWGITDPDVEVELQSAMQKEAAFLKKLETTEAVVGALRSIAQHSGDPYAYQAIAYILAREGNVQPAVAELEDLINSLDPSSDWELAMASRADLLKTKLLKNPEEAKKQLEAWESETIHNLGLEKFRK